MPSKETQSKYKPSSKQSKAIKLIKDMLGIRYTGTSFEDCSKFLDEHLKEALSKLSDKKPSDKQTAAIAKIERALDIKFDGTTSKEASEFISKYLESYRKALNPKGIKRG
jgi:hypothetical protein